MTAALAGNAGRDFSGLLEVPGQIGPADVLYFRQEVFRDGVVSQPEAEAILAMNASVAEKCAEWHEFFVEAISDYVVQQAEPRGYVSMANGEWLIECISADGRVESANELELLVKVLDKSHSSPEILVGFALNEVARAVLEGEGPLSRGGYLVPGVIGAGEVELIRRVLYAYGGHSGISISRTEAEILFDLNDRTAAVENDPAWRELFVKAIANYLMAAATDRAPSRAEAIIREEWLEDTDTDVGETLLGAVRGLGELLSRSFFDDLFDSAQQQVEKAWAERNARYEAAIRESETISDVEAEWLIDQLVRDGVIHDNEKALLAFIRRESPDIHPTLTPWLEKNAAGA